MVTNIVPFGSLHQTGPVAAAGSPASVIIHPSMVPRRDRRADLLWGASRSGKGVNAWFGAYWMAKTYGKKFLYLTAEPGAAPKQIKDAIKAGLGDEFSLVAKPHLLSILQSVLEGGKWPVYLKRNDGTIVRDFKSREAECDPDQYGLLIVDSGTSIGDELIKWLADPDNKATLPMTPGKDKFWIEDGDVKIGGSGMTHVGFATKIIQQMVVASANLPYQKVLWIFREQRASRGEKKNKDGDILVMGEPMYGPDLPGTAATPRVTSWFGGAYHCDKVPVGGEKDDRTDVKEKAGGMVLKGADTMADKFLHIPDWEYRIYLKPHPDPKTGILYDAGNRLEAYVNADKTIVKPFIVASEKKVGKGYVHTGLNTIWELERKFGANNADDLKEDLSDMLRRFNPAPTAPPEEAK